MSSSCFGFLGFAEAGREVSALATNRQWLSETVRAINLPDREAVAILKSVIDFGRLAMVGAVGLALADVAGIEAGRNGAAASSASPIPADIR